MLDLRVMSMVKSWFPCKCLLSFFFFVIFFFCLTFCLFILEWVVNGWVVGVSE